MTVRPLLTAVFAVTIFVSLIQVHASTEQINAPPSGISTDLPETCQAKYNGGETCQPQEKPVGRRYCGQKADGSTDFSSSKSVGGCVGDCSCKCNVCLAREKDHATIKFDFSQIQCGCTTCCFGDYRCGDPNLPNAVHCESNRVSTAEDIHNQMQEIAFPSVCTCAFNAAYGSDAQLDQSEVIYDWDKFAIKGSHYEGSCRGEYWCARTKFLVNCQQNLVAHVNQHIERCKKSGAKILLQNQTATEQDSDKIDELIALIEEVSTSKQKATGWNCG
jgi:hypothetical protein